jgi:hypothetical protein
MKITKQIEKYNPVDGTFFLVNNKPEEMLAKTWDIKNAYLIAAAPDLLEACKAVVKYHRENDSGEGELFGMDFVTTCIAAIRKAERGNR